MAESPNFARPWWRQSPLWIGAVPLLLFLLLSAVDLDAEQFTQQGQTVVSNLLGQRGWWWRCF